MNNTASITDYRYDALGRASASLQTTGGVGYRFGYGHVPAGMASMTYPSSTASNPRMVSYHFDDAGRADQVLDGAGAAYAGAVGYAPHGGIASLAFGATSSAHVQTTVYNSLLQATSVSMPDYLSLSYVYPVSGNNGNVAQQTIVRGTKRWAVAYGYDALNRLVSASESDAGAWNESYDYSAFGNRWVTAHTGLGALPPWVPTSASAYTAANQVAGWSYDYAGNVTADGAHSSVYNAENLQTSAVLGARREYYSYDGEGRRVKTLLCPTSAACTDQTAGAVATTFVYDAQSQLAAEYGAAAPAEGRRYLLQDPLGSTRLALKADWSIAEEHDYLPYGEDLAGYANHATVSESSRLLFTGKERDGEMGLDYFGARYLSAAMGRFTSPDLPLYDQSPFDPQSWNLYSYGRNNHLVNIDPSGRSCVKTQTVNPDGSKSDSSADDGDGKGCEAAGIKPDDQGGMGASGQQVNVSGKQGSLWDYLTTTVPRYVPNDTELPSGARNVFSKVYQNTWVIAQPVCSGGGFVFVGGGGNIPGTKIHAEGYFLPVDYESGKGFSSGVLGEVGIGHTPFAVGGEASVNWKTGQKSYAGLGFANKDVGGLKAGVASLGLLGDTHGNVGGYASVAGVGVGVYARPSFINGCPAH